MVESIAVVGISCQYPDARTPSELWENVLSQRRAFRRMPAERLRLEDYFSADKNTPDAIYSTNAAVIEGFEFDRVMFKISGSAFRSADLTHWLALDTAAKAFEDGGFSADLPKETTGVFLGNTLTGEFSRAGLMRLRYPFVRRMVEAVLRAENACVDKIPEVLTRLEDVYKEPFPPITEESLAGGLSNTIAGRICNYFDLKGGGFSIDGACSSSLLAVSNACSALVTGDLDVALAGGVDLSLDPFELVGFAKTGALAAEEMRVYDARSNGFFPGEGCGFVLLMREKDALREGRKIYAVIKGWGISSDGSGGITRPTAEGQMLAMKRAYRRAELDPESIAYFEGHGTGTTVGDVTELKALKGIRQNADEKAVLSSIKPLIGHTKAAAGVAGLIKTLMALKNEILPPMPNCEMPHTEIGGAFRILKEGEIWNKKLSLRAAVSSMGFGGINTHIVLERQREFPRTKMSHKEKTICATVQDAEIFFLNGQTRTDLLEKLKNLVHFAGKISFAELSDLAAHLSRNRDGGKYRAAIVASKPAELEKSLQNLIEKVATETAQIIEDNIFFGVAESEPR
ncbi:MAG TPA: beta-ketoacyl synthase N-terminal-like domain-containing protein, partial [Pyrinomonadaceae bacterium]|nr:beta-ketoacyl synthase N-terminal-like domain-containing protein [Pyrinomonadaceae bacterium]